MTAERDVEATADVSQGLGVIDGCDTLPKLFLLRCGTLGVRTAHREKALGIWRSYSWSDFLDSARAIGMGLVALGLKRGEVVSILSEDNKEWIYADLGVQCVGGIVTGVYPAHSQRGHRRARTGLHGREPQARARPTRAALHLGLQ